MTRLNPALPPGRARSYLPGRAAHYVRPGRRRARRARMRRAALNDPCSGHAVSTRLGGQLVAGSACDVAENTTSRRGQLSAVFEVRGEPSRHRLACTPGRWCARSDGPTRRESPSRCHPIGLGCFPPLSVEHSCRHAGCGRLGRAVPRSSATTRCRAAGDTRFSTHQISARSRGSSGRDVCARTHCGCVRFRSRRSVTGVTSQSQVTIVLRYDECKSASRHGPPLPATIVIGRTGLSGPHWRAG